jgi:hypothetical protein
MVDIAKVLAPVLAERRRHLERIGLPGIGLERIMDAFTNKPVRSPKGGPANLVSRAALRKPGVTNDTESVTFELEELFDLEADAKVIDYRTQALTLTVHPDEPLPDGGVRHRGWDIVPDQLVIELDRVVARDLMRQDELEDIAEKRPWYIHRDPDDPARFVCPSAVEAAAAYGIVYEIRSSAQRSRLKARGLRYLYDFVEHAIPVAVVETIINLVDRAPGITVGELMDEGRRADGWTVDDVLAAIAQRLVFIDLERHAPDDHAHARVYRDAVTARAFEAAHTPSWAVGNPRPLRPSIAPDTIYTIGDRRLKLFLCVGDKVHFTVEGEAGCPAILYSRDDFERMVAGGVLVADGGETLADVARQVAAAAWLVASPKARAIARERWRAVEVYRANRDAKRRRRALLPIPLVEGKVRSVTSLDRWHTASQASERSCGDVLVGLLPEVRPGGPGLRKDAWIEQIIEEEIAFNATAVGRSQKALVQRVQKRCIDRDKSVKPDRKTILKRLHRRDPYKWAVAHDGTSVAYKDKPYLPSDPDAMPVRGLYPFQRVHYDTTTFDDRVRCPISGRDLGRPILGELVDGFSDHSLTQGWGFGAPRVGDLLAVLVACAERFGRLPEELFLDNALSHWAAALQIFAAAHGMHVSYRPARQGRFGGPVEIGFRRITDALAHQVRGNTKAMKLVRSVTEATDAKTHAVLSLGELDYLVTLFHELVDEARIVKETGLTSKATFERGLIDHGRREARHVEVDELFMVQSLVPAGTRTAQGVKGIELDNLTYQHDCFRCFDVKGKTLDVSGNYLDVTRIWAFVPAHQHAAKRVDARWVEARCGLLKHLRFVSAHELAIATAAVRERLRDDNRKRAVRERAIAEVLLQAEQIEELAIERLRSISLASVRFPELVLRATPAPATATGTPIAGAAEDAPVTVLTEDDPVAALQRSIEAAYYGTATATAGANP